MQQSVEEKKEMNEAIQKTCVVSNIFYLTAHIAYLVFFLITQSMILVYINTVSISVYITFFFLIKYKKFSYYARGCGVEILVYMIIATILCGFDAGFHLCIVGLCVIAFYSSYFAKRTEVALLPVIWSILSCIVYIILFFLCQNIQPYYKLEYWAMATLFIIHALIVFGFITGYLWAFTKYVIRLEGRIKKESRTDRLTSIPNRYALYNYMDSLKDKDKYLLAIIDIDDFKKVNDIYGHVCGDFILKGIARLASRNSLCDFVARYGGEEFIIISMIENSIDYTLAKLDRIRQDVENYVFNFENQYVHTTITMGVAKYSENMTIDTWIEAADEKLYEGKNSGKNKLVM